MYNCAEAERLDGELFSFKLKFDVMDMKALRTKIADGSGNFEDSRTLREKESELETIARGYMDNGQFDDARSIIKDYELKTPLSEEIDKKEAWFISVGGRHPDDPKPKSKTPIDWKNIWDRTWPVLRIAVPIAAALAIAKYLVDNWQTILPIVVVFAFVYYWGRAWLRGFFNRFFRF